MHGIGVIHNAPNPFYSLFLVSLWPNQGLIFVNLEDQAFLAWTQEEEVIQRQKFLISLKDGLNLH
jgi:hypothetical protein